MTIEFAVFTAVLADDRSIQRNPRKNSPRPRVRQNLRVQQDVRIRRAGSSHRPSRGGRITADREFIRGQLFHTAAVHHQHDYLRRFATDLGAQASAAELDCGGTSPPALAPPDRPPPPPPTPTPHPPSLSSTR